MLVNLRGDDHAISRRNSTAMRASQLRLGHRRDFLLRRGWKSGEYPRLR
jgi:hypothetical protein